MTTVNLIKEDSGNIILQVSLEDSVTTIVSPNKYVFFQKETTEYFQITFEDEFGFEFPFKITIEPNGISGNVNSYDCNAYLKGREYMYKDSYTAKEKVKMYRNMEFEYPISYEMFDKMVKTLKDASEFKYLAAVDFDSNENEILTEREIYSFENTKPGIIYNGYSTENSS